MVHDLKSWPELFEAIIAGSKLHELRRTDRAFAVGDELLLREFDPKSAAYTGRTTRVRVTYITSANSPCALSETAVNPGFCILSIEKM